MALELVALEELGLDLKAHLVWSLDPLSWGQSRRLRVQRQAAALWVGRRSRNLKDLLRKKVTLYMPLATEIK